MQASTRIELDRMRTVWELPHVQHVVLSLDALRLSPHVRVGARLEAVRRHSLARWGRGRTDEEVLQLALHRVALHKEERRLRAVGEVELRVSLRPQPLGRKDGLCRVAEEMVIERYVCRTGRRAVSGLRRWHSSGRAEPGWGRTRGGGACRWAVLTAIRAKFRKVLHQKPTHVPDESRRVHCVGGEGHVLRH